MNRYGADLGSYRACLRAARRGSHARKLASIGGRVIIGEDGPIELNPLTARLLPA